MDFVYESYNRIDTNLQTKVKQMFSYYFHCHDSKRIKNVVLETLILKWLQTALPNKASDKLWWTEQNQLLKHYYFGLSLFWTQLLQILESEKNV